MKVIFGGSMEIVIFLVAFVIAAGAAFVRYLDKQQAEEQGLRSQYHDRCTYCGKRLKFQQGNLIAGKARESRCRACGADQPLQTVRYCYDPFAATGPPEGGVTFGRSTPIPPQKD